MSGELRGKPFPDWQEGDTARWRHAIEESDVAAFIALSGDTNPVHTDPAFARQHGFRGRVVHGMLAGAYISRVLGTVLPGAGTLWLSQSLRFSVPMYIGDVLEVAFTIKHKSEPLRSLVIETTIHNQHGHLVVTGEARVMMLQAATTRPWNEMVALVTGASRGIGAAIAVALGQKGAAVVVNYRERRESAEAVVEIIRSAGGRAAAMAADVSTREGSKRLVEAARQAFGPIDVVVNNATPPIVRKPFTEIQWEEIDDYLHTYVHGALAIAQGVVPDMKARGFGRLIHVLSSVVVGKPPPNMLGYVTAKHAVLGMCRTMAVELAPDGITVNAVSPSTVLTEQSADLGDARLRAIAASAPLRRLACPEDVAAAVLFLASEGGAYVTGTNIPLAGGEVM